MCSGLFNQREGKEASGQMGEAPVTGLSRPRRGVNKVTKAETDVFQELSCFFDDPTDVGNLMSRSTAFSKSSLNVWEFMVHIHINFFLGLLLLFSH